jgi:hypothetical protein
MDSTTGAGAPVGVIKGEAAVVVRGGAEVVGVGSDVPQAAIITASTSPRQSNANTNPLFFTRPSVSAVKISLVAILILSGQQINTSPACSGLYYQRFPLSNQTTAKEE